MKKVLSFICATVMLASTLSFAAGAYDADEKSKIDEAYSVLTSFTPGDADKSGSLTAADARATLLYSAGITAGNDIDTRKGLGDADFDGSITALDARILLRVSASLENADILYENLPEIYGYRLQMFNTIINNLKTDEVADPRFKKSFTNTCNNMTYDNKAAVDKLTSQMSKLSEDDFDFGKELTANSNTSNNSGTTNYVFRASQTTFPVEDEIFVSAISLSDIKSISYASNQSFSFVRKPSLGTETINLKGLDCITVNLKDETVVSYPDDITSLSHGKCFDIPTKDELESGYAEINSMFTGDIADMVGTITAGFKNMKYYNSYIKLYFDHDENRVCAVEYNLHYDFVASIFLNLYVPLLLNVQNETVNVTDTETVNSVYYFFDNCEAAGVLA